MRPSSPNLATLMPLTPIWRPDGFCPLRGPSFFPVATHSKITVLFPCGKILVMATLKSGYAVKVSFASAVIASFPDKSGDPGATTFAVCA